MLLSWDPNYSKYLRCGVAAFPAAAILSSCACCCPWETEGKECCLEKVDQVFVSLSGRYPEPVFICHVPEPTGLSLPLKDFCMGKS